MTEIEAPDLATVDTATLATLMRAGVDMIVVDAREPAKGMRFIAGARFLPVTSEGEEIEEMLGPKDTLVVTSCANLHCPASMALYKVLKDLGYQNVLEYPDGAAGWAAAGYPTAEAEHA